MITASTRYTDDEACYLSEWLDYHLSIGVDNFVLWQNSMRPVPDLLEKYGPKVSVYRFTSSPLEAYTFDQTLQVASSADWICFTDLDEFLLPLSQNTLPEVLSEFADFGGLAVGAYYFGPSGVKHRPDSQLEAYKYRLPDFAPLWKSIVKPQRTVSNAVPAHSFEYREPYFCVDENYRRVNVPKKHWTAPKRRHVWGDVLSANQPIINNARALDNADPSKHKLVINHYITRSEEEFEQKRKRWHKFMPEYASDATFSWVKNMNVYDNRINLLIRSRVPFS